MAFRPPGSKSPLARLATLLPVLALCIAPVSAKTYLTQPVVALGAEDLGTRVAVGRFNADALDDVAMIYGDFLIVRVQVPGQGLLPFYSVRLSELQIGYGSCAPAMCTLAVSDANGDGLDDIVVATWGGLASLTADPAGNGFIAHRSMVDFRRGRGALGDLDRDGDPDVLIASDNGYVGVVDNESAPYGNFNTYGMVAGAAAYLGSVAMGDLNRDGREDVAIIGQSLDEPYEPDRDVLYIFHSAGRYEWLLPQQTLTFRGGEFRALAIGDVNSDGRRDIVVSNGLAWPDSRVLVYLKDASGAFGVPVSYQALDVPSTVVIADVDGDGRNDVTVNHHGWSSVSTYLQAAEGLVLQFPMADASGALAEDYAITIGDFDDDGCRDVLADATTGYRLLVGQGCQAVPPVDIGLTAAASPTSARVTVRNKPASAAVANFDVQVNFQVDFNPEFPAGTHGPVFTAIPAGCTRKDLPWPSAYFTCRVTYMPPSAQLALDFVYRAPKQEFVHFDLQAWVRSANGHDPAPQDNAARVKVVDSPRSIGPLVPRPVPIH